MAAQLLRFTYPPQLVHEPVVYQLGSEFGLITNIKRANVTKDRGWVILELLGEAGEISRAVRWARDKGLEVEEVEGELPD